MRSTLVLLALSASSTRAATHAATAARSAPAAPRALHPLALAKSISPPRTLEETLRAKKRSFEAYTLSGEGSPIFPLPEKRDAVRLHKKHVGKGAAVAKVPLDLIASTRPTLDTADPKLRVVHLDPLVLTIDDFLSTDECADVIALTERYEPTRSPTFGASGVTRTSTTWYVRYQEVVRSLDRASRLVGLPIEHFEEPQIVCYQPGQSFGWHYDAVPATRLANGGQRVATLLVYLDEPAQGGSTAFRDLRTGLTDANGEAQRLEVQPKVGRALLFFPSSADGSADERTLHAGMSPMGSDKWILQHWVHERAYEPTGPEGSSQSEAAALLPHLAGAGTDT